MKKVAFICVHNSCRSQIAEALGKKFFKDCFECYSAGTKTKNEINNDAVRILQGMYNINMTKSQYPKLIKDIPQCDIYISMGCNVKCTVIPGAKNNNWGITDPTGKDDSFFISVIEDIKSKLDNLKNELSN